MIANASDAYTDEEIDRALEVVQREEEARILPHFGEPTIVSKRRAAHNYGHYLMEMLPMAVLARRAFNSSDARYLVHRVPPPSQDVVFRSFRLLGISLDRLLVQDFGQPMFFERLFIVRGLTEHGKYMSPLSAVAVEEMAKSKIRHRHDNAGSLLRQGICATHTRLEAWKSVVERRRGSSAAEFDGLLRYRTRLVDSGAADYDVSRCANSGRGLRCRNDQHCFLSDGS